MQRPKPWTLQLRLLVYLFAAVSCPTLWTSFTPRLFARAEVLGAPDTDLSDVPILHALASDELSGNGDASYDGVESEGYEPEFGYLDRDLIGRQVEEIDQLVNNQKMEKDIDPESTIHFVLERSQLRLRRADEVSEDALEARGTENMSHEAGLEGRDMAEAQDGEGLSKRQTNGTRVWITANTCKQPVPNGNATEASRNHPQLVMYVSTSPKNKRPGPSATDNTITNLTTGLFNSGYASFEFNTTSDVYIGISAPKLEEDWYGSWNFELAASTDGPYHNYNASDPFLYMIDTDSESALFITYDLGDSNSTEAVEKWKQQNPFSMYAFQAGEYTPITGMERSYCAIKDQFNVNTTRNFTIDSRITTKFGVNKDDNFPKNQFHVRGLQRATTYNGFVVIEGSQEPEYIPGAGMTRGGGRVFQAFNWTTKADDSCQVLFDLDFCDSVAYAVPSNASFKFNDTALAEIYDNQAREYYANFTKSLAQVACDAKPESQYSLARTCADCERDYKNWLCMVLIPRCEDWTAKKSYLQPRNINAPFANGSVPLRDEVALQFNATYPENVGFTQSRNPLIDELIKPGPYREMKPCEYICFDIVRSCPANLGFACPNGLQREVMYGKMDEDPNRLTCNFPGAVVKLNARGAAGMVQVSWLGLAVGLVAAMAWI
ncbi:hypothetical protein COCC4DRAFT_134557 [Bipolaris maydis ATCC 48331]|uniref:FZ domain-containing protein n=3 Tax=Cochliobolus heterostrophus TaxID=5016 RepID=M2UHY9_COCH5|nr:uncharacterized protein COCC4DRAFT_134557 [Bipolaris maydis ATCC 48331]EMD87618.1 hypothetical protein COCHEDRAFT_1184842 [Bipolaris maydis C5]KAH7554979.1 hypothetical protein BM1_07640 [Bipolaris maydis]ENI06817.1 hypothetical protein COCC4DRAFT_134557 [Bipolaris maydis ATCC 48331]KAJ5023117.1 stretch-activated Ca2+-permeable channel component-domain-containing protein [Bipolaris maydis]KAJ5056134.1 calcium channel subunit Mid1 [Bipolaris maydis]